MKLGGRGLVYIHSDARRSPMYFRPISALECVIFWLGGLRSHYRSKVINSGRGKMKGKGLVAQWITRLTADLKVPGANHGEIVFFFFCISMFIIEIVL